MLLLPRHSHLSVNEKGTRPQRPHSREGLGPLHCAPPERPAGGVRDPLLPRGATAPPNPLVPLPDAWPSRRPRSAAAAEPFRPLVPGPWLPGGQRAAGDGQRPPSIPLGPDRGHPAYPWGQTTLAAGSGDLLEVAPPLPLQGPASHSSPGKTWRPLSWALCFRCSGHQETDAQTQRRVGRDGQTPFREPRWQQRGALPQPPHD